MGILNVTPDSFSDGGRWLDPGAAAARGEQLVADGADLLDIGGESTRPGAQEVGEEEEARRVLPVLKALAGRVSVPLSVDTRRPGLARRAVECGACIVNDVMPFAGDAAMAAVLRETGAGVVLMHMRGTPRSMARLTSYDDVCGDVARELARALAFAVEQGIGAERAVVDPGIGFAKTTEQNVALLRALPQLCALAPVLVGVSRKRFIGELSGEPGPERRLGGSVAAALWCASRGASVLRVHDVKETCQALATMRALAGSEGLDEHV